MTSTDKTARSAFFSRRTALGLIIGFATWLAFAIFFDKPGDLTPSICMMITMMISRVSEPRQAAGLGIVLGFPAGFIWSLLYFLRQTGQPGLLEWLLLAPLGGIGAIFLIGLFSFTGFLYGTFVKLYRSGALL